MSISQSRFRTLVLLIFFVLTLILAAAIFFYGKQYFAAKTTVSEDLMIEKITNMGKLELVKYAMKDVIEKKQLNRILPDERILFVAVGEVTACIDLTKVGKEDIIHTGDSVTIYLPKPEICYVKLDHQRSKVYDVSGVWFPGDSQKMVEDIYKIAEQKILQNAKDMDITGKATQNAQSIFKPMLENMSGKKITLLFR
ncbi:MAG: DUF4230 domain-containing protein [Sphingobacteriaceae bacterium]